MSTLADQLGALGLKGASAAEPEPVLQVCEKPVVIADTEPPDTLLCELPRLGQVRSLSEEKGFGHLSCDGEAEHIFFHFSNCQPAAIGRHQESTLAVGEMLVFIAGTSPQNKDPERFRAVRWARVRDVPGLVGESVLDQKRLNDLRRKALERLSLHDLWRQLHAGWYVKEWRKATPADLTDLVLDDVWRGRLSALTPDELKKGQVRQEFAKCRYAFAAALAPDYPDCAFAQLLDMFSPQQLTMLGTPDSEWMSKATTTQKPPLLEWHLLSRADWPARGDWSKRLQGSTSYETAAAKNLLDAGLPQTDLTWQWIRLIVEQGRLAQHYVEQFAAHSVADAVDLFEQLSEELKQQYLASWNQRPAELSAALRDDPSRASKLTTYGALAIDLETDGERIWEVGCAQRGQSALLYAEKDGSDFTAAMAELGERIHGAPLLVGHNILAWDWPILARELKLDQPPLIWDTLLVQYLLEPGARSHALGGGHHADGDALATLALFTRQLQQLPDGFASQLMLGEIRDVRQLMDGITMALGESLSLTRSLPPAWRTKPGEAIPMVLLPQHRLDVVDWVPGVVLVQADPAERLPQSLWQIDGERLEQELAAAQFDSPATQVLLAVVWMAQAQGIVLRRNMIPLWLADSAPTLATALDRASVVPAAGTARCVSPLPSSETWWTKTDLADYRVAWDGDGALIVGRCQMAPADVERMAGGLRQNGLVCVDEGASSLWLRSDSAARMLDPRGGWSVFRSIPVAATQKLKLSPGKKVAASSLVLATRHELVLYPGAMDQATYWLEMLRTFREVVRMTDSAVPILLIGSSSSPALVDLLATGLAEIAVAEGRPAHRSRREHLLRAARRGLALVDGIDQWPAWLALGESAGVTLVPVVEALPLEEWYAAAHRDGSPKEMAVATVAGTAAMPSEAAPTSVAVSSATLLEALPGLTTRFLSTWLHASGLVGTGKSVWVLDPRAGSAAFALRACMRPRVVDGAAWSPDERSRLDVALAPLQVEREPAPDDYASMERFLVAHWQPPGEQGRNVVSGFKDSQKSAMETICARASDVLVPLPTGEGKSVLFQVPALCRGLRNRRLTLVISPLKALMKDQVARLREQGFAESADYLSGDLTPYEMDEVMQGVLDHRIILLYVAPERLRNPAFKDLLDKRIESDGGLEHVVVDETHCVNQWGYEFRPDYFHAMEYLLRTLRGDDEDVPSPFLLLSATVTASDRERLTAMLAAYPSKKLTSQMLVRPDAFTNPLRGHIAVLPQRVHGLINDKQGFALAVEERLLAIVEAIGDARRNKQATGQRSAVIVFVAWRTQAEDLAALLAARVGGGIDYYHAGLDGATRDEIYMRFREGELDVLVATKAFGMGMDIPDIHWVVHLGPPNYLEDYLQEVGRIGRGAAERQRAALESLSAVLLFSNADFESSRAMRAQGALQLPKIEEIRQAISAHAEDLAGERIAFVPQHGYDTYKTEGQKRANATRLRMALYWLERAGAVELHGVVADLLTVDLDFTKLRSIAGEKTPLGAVARTLLLLEEQKEGPPVVRDYSQHETGWLGSVLDGLSNALGFLFGVSAMPGSGDLSASTRATDSTGTDRREAVINLSQIRVRCEIKTMSEVMACLADLERRGGVTLQWTFAFAGRPLALEPTSRIRALFKSVGDSVENLIDRLSERVCVEFNPHELLDDGWEIQADDKLSDNERQRLRRRYERAWLHGFRSQARAAGLRLRQLVREDRTLVWEAKLASTKRMAARQRNIYLLKTAQSLFKLFKRNLDAGQDALSVPELIRAMQADEPTGQFRRNDLKPLLNLLAAISLVSARPETLPVSHVVVLRDPTPPLASRVDLQNELKQVNDLAEVRVQAIEVFANLPGEGRERFIEGYFAQKDAEGLKVFLDAQLGEIEDTDDEDLSGFIQIKREQLRATKVVEFFKRYEDSEEPNQWTAMQYPFQRHLLVNAGPGAGKTAVLVGRIAHLIREQQIKPGEIVVLAFNRAVVFEIKTRIRELFMSLGYGSYVRSVRVSTFHSLAMRSLANAGEQMARGRSENLLGDFARKLSSDARFREQVAGGCRCILVDEFQDVTEDVYAIICNLHLGSGSRAGVMVIGDDDQDILRWQRRQNGEKNEFAESFFTRFRSKFSEDEPAYLELGVNFRSGKAIVERSQKAITGFFDRNGQSSRLKESQLRPRHLADDHSDAKTLDWRRKSWGEALEHVVGLCREWRETSPGSLAVLCRSNAEVAEAYDRLAGAIPDLVVQGGANLHVADLRHVALWLEFLDRLMADRDGVLTDALRTELLETFRREVDIPETRAHMESSVSLTSLWDLCCQEHSFPHLSTLVRFTGDLQSDELQRLLGAGHGRAHAVVSTIHKVKGLEFDNVIVLPSGTSFGTRGSRSDGIERDAAEEARLLYVAMTRAKMRLVYFAGDREYAWAISPPTLHTGAQGTGLVLGGSMEDVGLGWAMVQNGFNRDPDGCQRYIEEQVRVGDAIVLPDSGIAAFKALLHRSQTGHLRQVGFLALKHNKGASTASLKVSAVVRFALKPTALANPSLADTVQQRGWGYVVLVSGRLR